MGVQEMANDNVRGVSTEGQPRRPYWLVGLVLLALVVAMLVGAFILDKQLRPQVGIEGSPAATIQQVTAVPAGGPTTQSQAEATAVNAAPVAGSSGDATKNTVPPEREVEQAYLKYWDVYAEAMLTLDTTRLPEVAAGERLKQAVGEVEKLKAQGKAAKIQIEHKYFVFDVTNKTATVHDEYVNSSYAVDPNTKQPVGAPGESERLVDSYFFERTDGVWKVVSGVRQ